ncbi:hypothetical protein BST81_08155 [Leptolyngbya sp. 'hensonii']|uniref:DUF1822 family protein n=1 Tax=Leptolyngbya sp. 'hensonii' TaxID=1922337 RepID=UPI0009502DF6|nr:DUF1822 family protein [Leptolyngbya sp. 'hensonii']OLP18879.1 hypothetical protein BST81_08155 [Leptolyngbya sp. 'hensonii']
MTVPGVPPTQLVLEIASGLQQQAWYQSQKCPQPQHRWTIYLNLVCLHTLLPWLQAEQVAQTSIWPNWESLMPFWTVVNGTAIAFGSKRLLLVPSQGLDARELCVPQEWVDLPTWAADYYLAVRVNPDEQWVHCWGYTTHAQLKQQAQYEPCDRTYCLDAQAMIPDLSVLWVVQQLYPDEPTRALIPPLPVLPELQAAELLQRLASPAIEAPRLEVPFQVWGALLEQVNWQQQLYENRYGAGSMNVLEAVKLPEVVELPPVNLRQWFEDVADSIWQSLDTLFESQPAFNFRRSDGANRGRGIRLPRPFSEEPIALIVNLDLEPDHRIKVKSQLYALGPSRTLPTGLRLEMVSESGQVLETVIARDQDNCIQLPRFKCPPGRLFRIRTSLQYLVFSTTFIS